MLNPGGVQWHDLGVGGGYKPDYYKNMNDFWKGWEFVSNYWENFVYRWSSQKHCGKFTAPNSYFLPRNVKTTDERQTC